MSDKLYTRDALLSLEAFERIDRVCLEYEQAWQCGRPPEIEALLGGFQGDERCSLLNHLMRLDIYYRRQRGSDPLPQEYCDRFPESSELIEAVFRASAVEDDENPAREEMDPATAPDILVDGAGGPAGEERGVVSIDCPHCGDRILLDDPRQQEVTCPYCGSTVEVDPQATVAYPFFPSKIGRYHVIERLGEGTFGVVYKAYDPKLKLYRAIKMARPETLDTEAKLERFHREACAAARLKHPNIVLALYVDYEKGVPYIVSEFIEGVTLDERLSGKPLDFHQAAELVGQVADALEYAHGEGMIHRDVKPSNIVIDQADKPCLTDFGLAHWEEDEVRVTLPGQILGSPAYMSPEQARGEARQVDARTDVYSLGVVLYELLTGELPFRGRRRMLLYQVQYDEPPPPRRLNDHVPRDLETICLKCLEKEPRSRYPSAQALRDDLHRYLRGEPILARPIAQTTRAWRWCLRHQLVSGLAATVVLLLVSLVVVLFLLLRSRAYTHALDMQLSLARAAFEAKLPDALAELREIRGPGLDDMIFEDPEGLPPLVVESEIPDLAPLAEHVPALIKVLKHGPQPEWRLQAAVLLGDLGAAANDAIPALERVKTEGSPENKVKADKALREIKSALRDALDALREGLQDRDSRVASGAQEALTRIKPALHFDLKEPSVEDQKQ